jgi:hypothetical protein
MKKTYKTKYTGYGIYVNINGVLQLVQFKQKLVPSDMVGSTFETEDKEMQKALEAHKHYGLSFWTDDKEEVVVDAKEEAQEEPKKVKRYKTKE